MARKLGGTTLYLCSTGSPEPLCAVVGCRQGREREGSGADAPCDAAGLLCSCSHAPACARLRQRPRRLPSSVRLHWCAFRPLLHVCRLLAGRAMRIALLIACLLSLIQSSWAGSLPLKVRSSRPAARRLRLHDAPRMLGDNARWADGGSHRRRWNEDPVAQAMAGSWRVEWSNEDQRQSAVVNLLADGRVAPPEDSDKTRLERVLDKQLNSGKKAVCLYGTWKLKGEEVNIIIHRTTTKESRAFGQTTIMFQGSIKNGTDVPYASHVKGNVLEGESDPEWLGELNLTQMVGKASLGMGPRGPTLKETRASSGFALGGRSDVSVLKRFSGSWDATMSLDGAQCAAVFELWPNGTFVTSSYTKVTDSVIKSGGVLRGRWNVYYSEDTKKDRFWLQVKRLKSSGVHLWQDLLFLGDIDVVDTWRDIQDVLAQQITLAASNVSAADEDATHAGDVAGGDPPSLAEGTTPEDRGIFTVGDRRKYRLAGSIMVGWMGEPAFVGKYRMVQATSTDTLQRLGSALDPDSA